MRKNKKQLWHRRIKRLGRRIHLSLVPHRHNHYRPHLIRRYGLLAVIGIAIGLQFGYNYTETGSVLGRVTTITSVGLLTSTNEERTKSDLPALQLNSQLSQAAAAKAHDMLEHGYWGHTAPDGTEPWVWIDRAGYSYSKAGENLAKNFSSADAVVSAWMNSPSHRENVLGANYQDVGFATAEGEVDGRSTTVTVAFYGAPQRSLVAGLTTTSRATQPSSVNTNLTLAARMGVALQSLTPAALTSLALLLVAATVAITAHFYRRKLPRQRRESWYKHHGVVKAAGLLSIAAFIVLLYGGGQL